MILEVSGFIPGLLDDTDKHIEVVEGHHVIEKQKGEVRIKMCNDNENTFFTTLHNVLLALDLFKRFFYVITLMNQDIIVSFVKGLAQCTLETKRKVWLP